MPSGGRIRRLLRVRPAESRVVARVFALMVVLWGGATVGATGVESLFFARFGPEHLPWMYVGLGILTFPATLVLGGLLHRWAPARVLAALPVGMALITVVMRVALLAPGAWPFPTLWLTMMVLWIGHGTFSWGVAGLVHDARQARRLFPLYGAGVILGGALGGLSTAPLAALLGAENLLVVWAGTLAAAHLLTRAATGAAGVLAGRGSEEGFLEGMRRGAVVVGRSTLLRWMAGTMVVLSLLYFSLSLPFAQAATARFPDADRLAAFLGLLQGAISTAALAVSLLVVNRLVARIGIAAAVLTFPALYLVGFAVVAMWPDFEPLVAFRFAQLMWMFGVWQIAWQAMFNVVPPEQRAGVRAFMDGGAMPAGIILAGALLLLAREALTTRQLFLVAVPVAAAAVLAAARVRRSFAGAVAHALRAGRPDVFTPEAEPLGGVVWDRAASSALAKGAADPDPGTRRITMEILGQVGAPGTHALRLEGLADEDPNVRAAALTALVRFPDAAAADRALVLLSDPEPVIRAAAVDATVVCTRTAPDAVAAVAPLLDDPDPTVRVRAAAALRRTAADPRATAVLERMATDGDPEARATAVRAMGEAGVDGPALLAAVRDEVPTVRRAAVEGLARLGNGAADRLLPALGDGDPLVREAAAEAIAGWDPMPLGALRTALRGEETAEGALMALARAGVDDPGPVRTLAEEHRDAALRWHRRWRAVAASDDERLRLLAFSIRHRALRHASMVLRAQAALGPADAIEVAMENLESRDVNQRANAVEMIEAVGDPELVRPLLSIWDPEPAPAGDPGGAVREMIEEPDPWIRACAVLAAALAEPGMAARLGVLARDDPDPLVRETAARASEGGEPMKTLTTMTLMDRVLALRQVPLFRELAPEDLQHVAAATAEHLYPDGTEIARAGEPGDALHVVVTGEVRVVRTAEGGRPVEVARLGPGYIVGEMAVLTDQPRMATLVALTDVRTLTLDRPRFQRILRERPDAALAVMRELCDRLRATTDRRASTMDPA